MASDHVAEFEAHRPRLFAVGYRLLGSAAEAEDLVQETFLRWNDADRDVVRTPAAWLTKVLTNLCLNRLASARSRREDYVGIWLPEPVMTDDSALGPLETAERRESVSLAMLVLMEKLTPVERAVFVLREAFGYRHREIAEILDITESNSQQVLRRAQAHLRERPRFDASGDQRRRIAELFLDAARGGDLPALERLLADDVVSSADGGGVAGAARNAIRGASRVARYFAGLLDVPLPGLELRVVELNGQPGILAVVGDALVSVTVVEVGDERVRRIYNVVNPDKLRFLAAQCGLVARNWRQVIEDTSGSVMELRAARFRE
ncbi:RNA polymerase ECF family sigma subunit [Saccharopolyspora erythraea NRRL 2338]|uniref:ECF-family RNA polymerase sigma factor n=2 Tax=Saccharopolyspora erythraea TaxID=1836 RepID=A4F9L5_SACEN|nr:RNA polymerase sigma-70 factor [Saccharopolyspora erythraea]EQD87329.1 RNA polymerase sigma 70 [Saccharopolyspora erythraea D]PFG94526.1 RNA polymerase ECF family sigma subunit [Saccharopolyspora erythraea NRRL 2338]QRK91275.1 RNA polymerase sigma-70 factor [Saccharopolyspora erythraea]CAM00740.1 putative ECF-family RNA polymerase sigma factor [Saccharopolyspora erythraea NRRL 2338]